MKKCPYCAEEIQDEAIICRFCGRDLTKETFELPSETRLQLANKLAEFEKSLAAFERVLQEKIQEAETANRSKTWAYIVALLGIFLIPFIVGIIIVLFGLDAAIKQSKIITQAEKDQSKARKTIEYIRGKITEIRIALDTNIYSENTVPGLLDLDIPNIEGVFSTKPFPAPKIKEPKPKDTPKRETAIKKGLSIETILILVIILLIILVSCLVLSSLSSFSSIY